ncbi:MAG: hypothetical protein JWM27_1012 [Gemmatimonadetes bacterium]|nr:hypothetical protein [Gemmatimonadota bacterium]
MRKLRFPHPLALLVGCILVAAALTWIVPAGQYDRREDPVTGRKVVVAGTYHRVPAHPVGPFDAIVAIPKGMGEAADVVFFVFLIGGALTVVDRTEALRRGAERLVGKLKNRGLVVIPIACLAFVIGGALENMQEEIIALVPILLILTRSLGFDPLTAVAMSLGSAAVGAAFSPVNPFQVGIAQKVAELPLLSGWGFRLALLAVAFAFWTYSTIRYARRTRVAPVIADAIPAASLDAAEAVDDAPAPRRQGLVLAIVLATFAVFVYGVLKLGWDFNQMAALFFVMGVVAGLVGGLGVGRTAEAFVEGFGGMAFAALLIGFARSIYVVLDQGAIVDTMVNAMLVPISHLPVTLAALGMVGLHTLVHVPVPSVSGQAVLTMPLLVPLSDLLGLGRQVTVLAYETGAGLCELLTPTNGALMAILAAAGVRYDDWLRFVLPRYLVLLALGSGAVVLAIAIGLK